MSQEIFEIVKQMNLDNLEVQIALQCAPPDKWLFKIFQSI